MNQLFMGKIKLARILPYVARQDLIDLTAVNSDTSSAHGVFTIIQRRLMNYQSEFKSIVDKLITYNDEE